LVSFHAPRSNAAPLRATPATESTPGILAVTGNDGVEYGVNAARGAAACLAMPARKPIRQSQQRHDVDLPDPSLILAEPVDNLAGMVPAQLAPKEGPADDFRGQPGGFLEHVDGAAFLRGPAFACRHRRFDHDRREFRQPRHVNDGSDNAPPFAPGVAIAHEQAIAEQGRQRMTHLRALALETGVVETEGELNGGGAVAQEAPPHEQ